MNPTVNRPTARVLLLVTLVAVLLPLAPIRPATAMHPWGSYHWYRTGSTVSLTWRNQAGSSYATYINNALARWGSRYADPAHGGPSGGAYYPTGPARSDFSLSYTSGGSPSCTRSTDTANGERNVTFCISAGEISGASDATVELYSAPNGAGTHIVSGLVWIEPAHATRQDVYCHEAGHTFALQHSTNSTSCMKSGTTTSDTYPDQHDLDLSRTQNNAHTHSTATTTTTTASTTTTTTWTTTTTRCTVPNPTGGCLVR